MTHHRINGTIFVRGRAKQGHAPDRDAAGDLLVAADGDKYGGGAYCRRQFGSGLLPPSCLMRRHLPISTRLHLPMHLYIPSMVASAYAITLSASFAVRCGMARV